MSSRRLRLALLLCAAVLGLAASYAFVGGSSAATPAVTTLPNPDPPPPPPPPPRHIQPPPPPPPPPPAYTPPPPPPPVVYSPPSPPPAVVVSPPRVVRHHARPQPKKEVPIASPISVVVHPDIAGGPGATLRPAASPVAVSMSHGSSSFLKLALAAALVLSLLVVALALAPPRLVPEPLELRLYGRHEDLIVGGLATALSIGFGLLIVLFVS